MKKPKIFFRPIGESGPLSVYWYEGPYGDAVEAINGTGVAWYSPTGELLGVEFDDVKKDEDTQKLNLQNGKQVELIVLKGKANVKIVTKPMRTILSQRRKKDIISR